MRTGRPLRLVLLLLPVAVLAILLAGAMATNGDGHDAGRTDDPAGPGRLRLEIGGDPLPGGDPVPPRRGGTVGSDSGGGNGAGGGTDQPPPPRVIRHRVERGDTLRGLARQYYGDPERWGEIQVANGLPDETIVEGTVLVIP